MLIDNAQGPGSTCVGEPRISVANIRQTGKPSQYYVTNHPDQLSQYTIDGQTNWQNPYCALLGRYQKIRRPSNSDKQ